jgi:hypothetical protein
MAEIKREAVESGTIRSIGHAPGELHVEFKNGGVYRYTGPKVDEHYANLMKAPSKGTYFAQNVRKCPHTKFEKLPPTK